MTHDEEQTNLQALADTLRAAGTRTGKRVQRERLEVEWQTKQRARKAQQEPDGLFAQEQLTLEARRCPTCHQRYRLQLAMCARCRAAVGCGCCDCDEPAMILEEA